MIAAKSDNLLADWFVASRSTINEIDLHAHYVDERRCVDIDGPGIMGTITHWNPNLFEFHLVKIDAQDVMCIETCELDSIDEITRKLIEIVNKFLIKTDRRK